MFVVVIFHAIFNLVDINFFDIFTSVFATILCGKIRYGLRETSKVLA